MSSSGSVTFWINRLKGGDRLAVQKLWEGYFRRLVGLARKKLQGRPAQAADEEDIALSAFDSFCRAAEGGRFPRLDDRNDLWQLLLLITSRKVIRLRQHEGRLRRGGKVIPFSALEAADPDSAASGLVEALACEPDPALATEVAEQCQQLLDVLGDPELSLMAVRKLEGFTNAEIACQVGRAVGTVERKLKLIRRI